MGILEDKKTSRNLLIVALLLYFIVYFGRYSYNATIVNMVHDGVMTKTQSGTLISLFYVFFAIGSLFAYKICDKKYTYIVLFATAAGVAISNLGFYFSQSFIVLAVSYSVNAVCQSLMFVPIFVVINTNIQPAHRATGVKYFSLLYPLARLFDNIMVILSMLIGSYKFLYIFCFAIITAVALLWLFNWQFGVKKQYSAQQKNLKTVIIPPPEQLPPQELLNGETKKRNPYKEMGLVRLFWATGFFIILIINLARVALTNGTDTWIPTIIMETFVATPLVSQITTLVFPVLNVLGIYLGIITFNKLKNEALVAGIYFFASAAPLVFLLFMKDIGFAMTIVMFCLCNILIYPYFYLLNSQIIAEFRKTNRLPVASSILTFNGSIGFIVTSYLFGWIADIINWNTVILIWVIVASAGGLLCLAIIKKWGEFKKYDK